MKSSKALSILYFLILFLILQLQSCIDSEVSPYPAVVFQPESVMSTEGRSSAVAFAINGKGYVALGKRNLSSTFLKDCWEFDPSSNNWTEKDSFPGVPRVKAIAAVVGGKAYVGLGFAEGEVYQSSSLYLHDFWSFDPIANKWSSLSNFPSNSTDACVSFVYKNEIYVGSGYDGFVSQNDFWKYSPDNDTWTQMQNLPENSRFGAVACTDGVRIFFGTGFRSFSANDWWEYLPESDSWIERKNMKDGRVNATSFAVNNRFFVSTGRFFAGEFTGGHVKSDLLEYNANLDLWYNRGKIPNGNRENAVSFVINEKIYIGFGENNQSVLNDLWSFQL